MVAVGEFPPAGLPTGYSLPIWNGQDTNFVAHRLDPNDPNVELDFGDNISAKIVITSLRTELEFPAVISGSRARFVIDDEAVKGVKTGSKWRLQLTINGKDRAPINGKVVRKDA